MLESGQGYLTKEGFAYDKTFLIVIAKSKSRIEPNMRQRLS
jgi:hypothetical protein